MNKYIFSTQKGKAYYCNSIPGFIKDTCVSIVGQLVRHSVEINKDQSVAWENHIEDLQKRLADCGMEGDIMFEYDIVRLGKRIDVILLIRHMVFSLRVGKSIRLPDFNSNEGTTLQQKPRLRGLSRQTDLFAERI